MRSYRYSTVHDSLGLCNGSNPDAARWVKMVGDWIEGGAPADFDYYNNNAAGDRFHPTLAAAFTDNAGCTPGQGLSVSIWDDVGELSALALYRGKINAGGLLREHRTSSTNPLANGVYPFDLSGIGPDDQLILVATDGAGNRQIEETNFDRLISHCRIGNNLDPPIGGNGGGNIQLSGGGNATRGLTSFTVTPSGSLPATTRFVVIGAMARGQTPIPGLNITLDLQWDSLSDATMQTLTGDLSQRTVTLPIPPNTQPLQTYFQAVAIHPVSGRAYKSNVISPVLSNVDSGSGGGNGGGNPPVFDGPGLLEARLSDGPGCAAAPAPANTLDLSFVLTGLLVVGWGIRRKRNSTCRQNNTGDTGWAG
jgi:hypothetical protein